MVWSAASIIIDRRIAGRGKRGIKRGTINREPTTRRKIIISVSDIYLSGH
jgi:hypothetical protein